MRPQLFKSISAEPSMVLVDGPEDGEWCEWSQVCALMQNIRDIADTPEWFGTPCAQAIRAFLDTVKG